MPGTERRRRRPALSCTLCRQRKIRCNRQQPCNHCLRAKSPHAVCTYDSPPPKTPAAAPRDAGGQAALNLPLQPRYICSLLQPLGVGHEPAIAPPAEASHRGSFPPTPEGSSASQDVELMRIQVAFLEDKISQMNRRDTPGPSERVGNVEEQRRAQHEHVELFAGTANKGRPDRVDHADSELFGSAQFTSRSMMHKKRLFGQSHWVNGIGLFRDVFESFNSETISSSTLLHDVRKCKEYGRIIKARRQPAWPTLPTTDLPPRDLADKLVDCYLRTIESVYRIIHVPTFRKEYEALYTPQSTPDMANVMMLKAILALGAASYDQGFSLRESAYRWVHEVYTWLCRPDFKARLSLKSMQTSTLLIIARQLIGVGKTWIWPSLGELMRTAIFTGLHRDPARLPRQTVLSSELRRRLWNTLLELDLQASLDIGAPPSMTACDFDTKPPENFDDEQLTDEQDAKAKDDSQFTGVSIARLLRHTYPARLAIVKFLNDIGSENTYRETLQLDSRLRAAHKPLSQSIQRWKSGTGPSPSDFQTKLVDCIVRRCLLAVHVPFFGVSFTDTAYAYTRKVILDNSLTLWRTIHTPPDGPRAATEDDFARLTSNRTGFLNSLAIQTAHLLLAELRAQVGQNDTLAAPAIRSDLYAILEEARDRFLNGIRLGEVNIKGLILTSMVVTQIKALMRGEDPEKIPELLVEAIIEAKDLCLPILREAATAGQPTEESSADMTADYQTMEDWELPSQVPHGGFDFSFSLMNPDNWVFDDHEMFPTPSI